MRHGESGDDPRMFRSKLHIRDFESCLFVLFVFQYYEGSCTPRPLFGVAYFAIITLRYSFNSFVKSISILRLSVPWSMISTVPLAFVYRSLGTPLVTTLTIFSPPIIPLIMISIGANISSVRFARITHFCKYCNGSFACSDAYPSHRNNTKSENCKYSLKICTGVRYLCTRRSCVFRARYSLLWLLRRPHRQDWCRLPSHILLPCRSRRIACSPAS
jgi:hypothetical protein